MGLSVSGQNPLFINSSSRFRAPPGPQAGFIKKALLLHGSWLYEFQIFPCFRLNSPLLKGNVLAIGNGTGVVKKSTRLPSASAE